MHNKDKDNDNDKRIMITIIRIMITIIRIMITMMMILLPRKPLFPGQYEVDQLGKIFEASFEMFIFVTFF